MYTYFRNLAKKTPLGAIVRWCKRHWRPPSSETVLDPIAQQHRAYDRDTVAIIHRVLRGAAVGVDVGAHAGVILRAMVAAAPQARHYAFEPLPHLAAQLRADFPQLRIYPYAVGDTAGTTTFLHVVNDPGYSGLRRRDYDRPDPVVQEIPVTVVRLDDIIPATESIAFIKLDIEGGEYHALRGAMATIRRSRPVIVFEAARRSTGCYGVSAGDLFHLITHDIGYHLWTLAGWLHDQPPYTYTAWEDHWQTGQEYYFVAAPPRRAG
ncbi:MAG: FkbM family methyltransferase [Gemmataceae bacterium]|nr:FkbM family methyltransferase [Gemmata sp.]MDW8198295.1 FkbM family methyltransferase [Gemmataceae bacterium]